jgi:predicted metal-dependent phosphoesterase TrpH
MVGVSFPQNADLHCHSVVSDGTLTPEQLAARARANGVDLWSLTDHDEIGGQQRALEAARAESMRYLTGVEVSVTFADETVHIVGLGFDHTDPRMAEGLADTRDGRGPRAIEMGEQLAKVGIPGAYEGALKYVGNPRLISRTHFARFLVETGVCRTRPRCSASYLVEGKPGYVPHRWARLGDAVRWITRPAAWRWWRIRRATTSRRRRNTRCFPNSSSTAGRASRWSPAATARPRRCATPSWRASSAWPPRAAATSTAPTKATSTWADWPRCPPT